MISSNLKSKRTGITDFFPDICKSCADELESLGIACEVYLIPGGVGIKFLAEQPGPLDLNRLIHLPILELDF